MYDSGIGIAVLEYEIESGEQLAQELIADRHLIDILELRWSRKAARFAQTDYWDQAGSVSAIDHLRHACHMHEMAVADRVAVGRRVSELAESHQSMNDSKIGFAHLTTMVRTAEAVDAGFEESQLLKQAEENSPGKFFHICGTTATPRTKTSTPRSRRSRSGRAPSG